MISESFAPLQALLESQYTLERELGRGGMGVVYLARDIRLDRLVAIKVLPRTMAGDPELRERFLREARTSAQLSHPNIVPIYGATFEVFHLPPVLLASGVTKRLGLGGHRLQ
jgi:serine/threonine-protein kinase